MQLSDVLCYIFLTITVTASCVEAKRIPNEIQKAEPDKRIRKREATVLIDNFPYQRAVQKPKTIYRRISKHRYVQPKTKYGPPKHKYVTKSRVPPKKVRPKRPLPKRSYNSRKPHYPKISYGPPQQRPKSNPAYGPPKPSPSSYSYFTPAGTGFGEPPVQLDYMHQLPLSDHRPPKETYGEPPVNSYGEPIKPVYEDEAYPTGDEFSSSKGHLENQDFILRQGYQPWMDFRNEQHGEPSTRLIKKVPKPNPVYVTPVPMDMYDDINLDAKYEETQATTTVLKHNDYYAPKKKPSYYASYPKTVRKPWKVQKEPEDDIIVGGQYAEPPARVVHKFQPSAPMIDDDDEFSPKQPFAASSATNSPYVNYKHSNLAFSPQNLNDVFSIANK